MGKRDQKDRFLAKRSFIHGKIVNYLSPKICFVQIKSRAIISFKLVQKALCEHQEAIERTPRGILNAKERCARSRQKDSLPIPRSHVFTRILDIKAAKRVASQSRTGVFHWCRGRKPMGKGKEP